MRTQSLMRLLLAPVASIALFVSSGQSGVIGAPPPVPDWGALLVSRSVYGGSASTVTIGQALPGGGTAIADGSYPGVWANEGPDASFGVTSPIFIDRFSVSSTTLAPVATLNVPTGQLVTSFSSKSELALNPSTDGKNVTFMGYAAGVN
jgi:hypothetical protein